MKTLKKITIIGLITMLLVVPMIAAMPKTALAASATVTRSFSSATPVAGASLTVSLTVNTGTDTYYAIDEVVPAGWVISNPGTGDTSQSGHIKWVVITGAASTTYQYIITVPASASGVNTFSGTYGSETIPTPIAIMGLSDVNVQPAAVTFTLTYTAGANGTITGTSPQTVNSGASGTAVTAVPNANFHFVDWSDASTANPRTDTNVLANISVTANFAADAPILTTINVTPASPSIVAGNTQQFTANALDQYGVAMNPQPAFTWASNNLPVATIDAATGLATGVSAGGPVTITATNGAVSGTASLTVTAAPPATFNIVSSAGANGSISPLGTTAVASAGSQTYTITPNAGFQVADVLVDGVSVGAVTSYPFTNVLAAHTISASFSAITYTLTYTAGANGTITGTSPQTVNAGADGSTVTAVANAGFHFVNWSDGALTAARTDLAVAGNISVTANFAADQITYTLTYTAGANGTITGTSPQTVNSGASGTAVTAVPNAGYHFVDWSDASTANPRTDTNVLANISVTANFAINTFTITSSAGANGSISPLGATLVNSGASQAYTITPNAGFNIADVLVDGVSQGAIATYTFNNVTANHTISASFSAIPPVLTTIIVTPAIATTTVGATQQFIATAYDQFSVALAVQPTFTWASASTTTATVDATGLATGISAGGPIAITATSGAVSGSANLAVTAVPVLTTITVSPANASIAAGNTQQFTAVALDQFSNPIAATIAWSSSNMAAATIDAAGLASGLAIGTSTITATSGTVSGTANLTVTAVPVLTTITVSPATATTTVGATQQFIATALDQFSNPITAPLSWASSNLAAGTINASGLFSALAAGTSTITATSGAISGAAQVNVVTPVLTSINVTPATATTTVGATQQFIATAYDQFSVALAVQPTFTWASASTTIATVNATGLATGITAGTVNITATSGAISGTAVLNVVVPALTSIRVTPANPILKVASTLQMHATGLDQSGMALITQPAFTWASSNITVASISSTTGLATGLAVGASTITATSGAISGTAALTVSTSTRIDLECDGTREIEKELEDSGSLIPEIDDDYASTTALTSTHDTHIRIISPDGDDSIDLPDGVRITAEDGFSFDGHLLIATSTNEGLLSGFASNEAAEGAIRWGLANRTLLFSSPITISIYVSAAHNGQTLNVRRSLLGTSGWTTDGIVAPATCVVANGLCTFQATKASYYAATTITSVTPPPSSGGGGGGGGGYIGGSVITPPSTSSVPTPTTSNTTPTPTTVVPPQVLGVKIYADGTLLRSPDMKIYFIVNGMKLHIRTLAELQSYKGRPIYNVSAEVLAAYPEVLGLKIYANGQLIRGTDMKIYVIVNGMKQLIRSLTELQNYKGQTIYNVSNDVLAQYPMVLGVKIYANGQLIRGADMRVYVIVDGAKLHLKTLAQLNAYRGRPIYSVTADVLASYPTAN